MRRSPVDVSFRSIVVPLDGSEQSARVLPVAELLAGVSGAELHLVLVEDALQPAGTRDAYAYLNEIAARGRTTGLSVRATVRMGDPALAILMLAQEVRADLVVMATSGHVGLGRVAMGSVADKVARSSRVPVVLLHPDHSDIQRLGTLLVPVDATPEGSAALAIAAPLARAAGALLVLVHAHVQDDMRPIGTIVASLKQAGLDAEVHVGVGDPATVITATANAVNADLIVMSTHARGGPVRSIMGSVADEVVRRSHRPVLLVRRKPLADRLEATAAEWNPKFGSAHLV